MHRTRVAVLAAGLAVLGSLSTALPTGAVTSTAHALAPPFARISESSIGGDTIEQPSIARFGNTYEVVWVHVTGTTNKTYGINARILNASGKAVGGIINVVSGWIAIRDYPTILFANGQRVIAFNGNRQNGTGTNPYDQPAEYYLTSSDGISWTLASGSLSPAIAPDGSDGTAAALGSSSIVTALRDGDHIDYNVGFSPANPATTWTGTSDNTGNFAAFPGVATAAGKVWLSWYSNDSSVANHLGVQVQQVQPSLGTRRQAPGSHKGGAASPVQQGVPLVIRSGTSGPPYTAYVQYDTNRVYVWRFGASSAIGLRATGAYNVTLTSAPAGRLWVYWWDSKGWHATRSNRAATRFGPVTTIPFPSNTNHAAIAGYGAAGPLEAVSLSIPGYNPANAAIFATQIKPRLSCGRSPASVNPGAKVAIVVRDAGDAVAGATVHFMGMTAKTNKYGVAHFTVPSGASAGKRTAYAGRAGYTGCSTTVRVT